MKGHVDRLYSEAANPNLDQEEREEAEEDAEDVEEVVNTVESEVTIEAAKLEQSAPLSRDPKYLGTPELGRGGIRQRNARTRPPHAGRRPASRPGVDTR